VRERAAQLSHASPKTCSTRTNAFALFIDDAGKLAGMPDDALQMLREAAAEDGRDGYKISLHSPSYTRYCSTPMTARWALVHRASHTRASEHGKPEWDNSGR